MKLPWVLSLIPHMHVVVHTSNPWLESGGSEVQGYPRYIMNVRLSWGTETISTPASRCSSSILYTKADMTNCDQLLHSRMAGVMRYATQGRSAQPHYLYTIMAAFLLSWKSWVVAEGTHNQPKVLTICPVWKRLPFQTFVNLPSYFL